ncbi:MAG: transporter substrate-binding protein [Betaproteobacteria bacterium]|jgi:tripartite-type tricarboxylate transporter receptor subunit TctC|nr:transporter substrate-binding protein [Betaproteobacteria bacterium]
MVFFCSVGKIFSLAACACAALLPVAVLAQTATPPYPVRVVRVIVPFPPGAGVDIVTRIVVPRMAESLGQSFVVDNRGGAGGIVGTELAARSPADGYNLYVGGTALIVTPLMGKVPYSARDLAPISRIASVPFILVVHPTMPVKSLRDLIALARAKPGAINYASTGNGTTPHLTTELFRQVAKIDITHVPYKGSAPALTDLLGGHVDMFFCNMLSATPHVSSGKLRALAVSSLQRSPVVPQVPTVAESGFPNFETVTWFGLMAPTGVPEYVVAKLRSEVVKALRRADVQSELAGQGASPTIDRGPDDMANYMKAETEKWGKVISALGLRAQ